MIGHSWIVLEVGKRRIHTRELVDGEQIFSVERREDALLVEWAMSIEDLEPLEEAAEEVLVLLGGELLGFHADSRGILVLPVRGMETPNGPYATLVAKHAATGVWLENLSGEPGANPARDMRAEISLPDVPRSRHVETFVMSPARAVRELAAVAPLRAVCVDRITQLTPKEVSGFYLSLLRAQGVKAKRRVWSDGSAEQLVARMGDRKVIVHAEVGDGGTFVRLASILER
ncbi:MAG: hypothetical protein U0270_15300 [Labilithrix sp.]